MRYWDVDDAYDDDTPTNAELLAQEEQDETETARELEERPWRNCRECKDLTQHDTDFLDMCEKCQTAYEGEIEEAGEQ